MLDVRFNILNEKVDKFIVVESLFSHSGKPKKLNFDIKNYQKFKDKINYIIIENEPEGLIVNQNLSSAEKRLNSLKRVEQSYDYMSKSLNDAEDNDLIILSDNDEIPNLNSKQFLNSKKNIFIFEQLFFYYKFNLHYDLMNWFGSKACRKKKLMSMSWLRNLKNKQYPFWRFDTLFSKTKYNNLEIIKDGGWHFTNLMTAEKLYEKMSNFGHHNEFDESGLKINDIKNKIENREMFYNHFLDQTNPNKWKNDYKLKIINENKLPLYVIQNKEKFKEWFA
jgi:beta-1,4-mannosyl-glycoprotein beta-1,4-N-acetylglucosaminyltransferase